MKKIIYFLKEAKHLVTKHKVYFLVPLLIIICILTAVAFYIGPAVIYSFIYAGF